MKTCVKISISLLLSFTISKSIAQQSTLEIQNANFERDIELIVEELKFMYDTDQALREYSLFKTYNKAITDSIEKLPQEKVLEYIYANNYKSDSLAKRINQKYILPIDELNTMRIIEMIKTYGFPSKNRIQKIYKNALDEEFNPYILIVHAPKKYWDELKAIIKVALDNKQLNRCEYGHILWHLNGRKNTQDMLDNGYKMVRNEEGQEAITAVDCE